MEEEKDNPPSSLSAKPSLRWGILRKAFLSRDNSSHTDTTTATSEMGEKLKLISRKTGQGFNLIKSQLINKNKITSTLDEQHLGDESNDIYVSYTLPLDTAPTLIMRSKRIIELGAGYGLAGLVIAAGIDVSEQVPEVLNTFDIIVASDCTFFKEFHEGLAKTVKSLLKVSEASEAIFLSPKRGNSLDKFLEKVNEIGMHYSITENYDKEVWQQHQKFLQGDDSWPNYEKDHSYPLLVSITF
ncbi:hypothetical protein MKW94_026907 [Papaver nudicaule]|uniref:Calmodulin-lysine N-methyltransferase n=1 Tax=Papaver nudicaule TaxID=74823 RepID=A0AA42AT88_PAPNU|nr:hypothetical protein [Papaver nudicaule]